MKNWIYFVCGTFVFCFGLLQFSDASVAQSPTMTLSPEGDISLRRSTAESELALRAIDELQDALIESDVHGIVNVALMIKELGDPIGISSEELAFGAAMTLRPSHASTAKAPKNRVVALTSNDLLKIALRLAYHSGDKALVDDVEKLMKSLPKPTPLRRQACIWGNCCGYYNCWNWCQWW